jgi:peptidoglycan/LPS O-acetylase OafA/YrhL
MLPRHAVATTRQLRRVRRRTAVGPKSVPDLAWWSLLPASINPWCTAPVFIGVNDRPPVLTTRCHDQVPDLESKMHYRREVDGLRAVAVLPVILFHAGFQTFSGGFVGVDVFFLISGYLITSIVIAEQQAGTFTLAGFYERRARRILPALFVVLAACLPFAWAWLLPPDMKTFALGLAAVVLFLSNIFCANQGGYFDKAAELNPLLHTWSLSVEEQYYLLFPVLMVAAWRFGRRLTFAALLAGAIASFGLAQRSVDGSAAGFYLLPTRGWELLAGALVAIHLSNDSRSPPAKWVSELFSLVGLVMVAYSVAALDSRTPFPGLYALWPVGGASLIVLFATPSTSVGRLLGSRLLVGLGLISYSAYLWHQPLLAFARHRSSQEPSQVLLALLSAAAIVLAYWTWKYIETPLRDKARFSRRAVLTCSAVGCLGFVAIAGVALESNGFAFRVPVDQQRLLVFEETKHTAALQLDGYRMGVCLLEPRQGFQEFGSSCQPSGSAESMLVWGDSHAAALAHGLRQVGINVAQYTASACPPIMDATVSKRPHCKSVNDFVSGRLTAIAPLRVVLHAHWRAYVDQDPVANIAKTVAVIRKALPTAEIVVVGPVPQWSPSLPGYLVRRQIGLDREQRVETPLLRELVLIDKALGAEVVQLGARYFSAIEALCSEGRCLAIVNFNGELTPLVWDYGHLTAGGAAFLAKRLLTQQAD